MDSNSQVVFNVEDLIDRFNTSKKGKVMKKKFEFEFDDASSSNRISFDFDDEIDEEMTIAIENNMPVLYANKQAYLVLAKTFIKLALGDYSNEFHFQLRQNFDADEPEVIRCHIVNSPAE
jgi:hypothetical protein